MDNTVEGRPLEDAELVRLARRGEVDAFGELVERYREIAFRTAYLIARNAADAEDATQEAFVKAYHALGRFREDAPFRPWVLRIVANEAKNRRRSARRRQALALRVAEAHPSGASAQAPEAVAVRTESARELVAAISRLPERDRLVISYRYLLELSELETAAALGVRPGTVKSRLSRALARLRTLLPAEDPARVVEATDG